MIQPMMCAPAEPLFFVRDRVQILLRRGGEEALILNEADSAVQKKVRRHYDEDRHRSYRHKNPTTLLKV